MFLKGAKFFCELIEPKSFFYKINIKNHFFAGIIQVSWSAASVVHLSSPLESQPLPSAHRSTPDASRHSQRPSLVCFGDLGCSCGPNLQNAQSWQSHHQSVAHSIRQGCVFYRDKGDSLPIARFSLQKFEKWKIVFFKDKWHSAPITISSLIFKNEPHVWNMKFNSNN